MLRKDRFCQLLAAFALVQFLVLTVAFGVLLALGITGIATFALYYAIPRLWSGEADKSRFFGVAPPPPRSRPRSCRMNWKFTSLSERPPDNHLCNCRLDYDGAFDCKWG